MSTQSHYPKKIFSLWLQGRDHAPEIVKANWCRWQALNPDDELVILERPDAHDLMAAWPVETSELTPQNMSDLVRIELLSRNGGIWVDASTFPVRPLADWLAPLGAQSGFFAFRRDGDARPLANWFLAAVPGSMIITKWRSQILRYWSAPHQPIENATDGKIIDKDPIAFMGLDDPAPSNQRPNFWMHYLFYYLLQRDEKFRQAWAACASSDVQASHALQRLNRQRLRHGARRPVRALLTSAAQMLSGDPALVRAVISADVQKLNWRHAYPIARIIRAADQPER